MTEIDPAEQRALALLESYESCIRAELEVLGSTLVPDLDEAAKHLRAALATKRAVHVGFLGESQVGKSSLINALVGRLALPTGGVGPLTAQATRLRHGAAPSLGVRYHDRKRLNQFLFALRQYLSARGELIAPSDDSEAPDGEDDVTAIAWSSAASVESSDAKSPSKTDTGEYLLEQARLMLGAGSLANGTVHDAIRLVLNLAPLGDATALAGWGSRIAEIRELLGGTARHAEDAANPRAFTEALQVNAAGWRSPLVADLDLALGVDLLQRVEVVDLPGVGVVGDPAGRVAEDFVRDDASALVIVARNNGLTKEVVGLLERTGVVTRLLFGGESVKTNPIHVIFAITRLDDVAQDRWKQERSQAKQNGVPPPSREEVFTRLAREMEEKAKDQIRRVLSSSSQFEDLPPEMRTRREEVVRELCERTEVICVSAKDFMNIESDDAEDVELAFLKDPVATNIPHFRERLAELAERARGSRRGRITRALETFRSLLVSHVDALALGGREHQGPASDADRFRESLAEIVPEFRQRANAQRREVSRYLRETVVPKLEGVSDKAGETTRKRLLRLRKRGEQLHWASLNAALVRNGQWERQGIDYPAELTSGFVDVVAGAWEPSILEEVRKVVRKLVDDHVELVEEFLAQASQLSGGEELLGQITAQKRVLKEQGKSAVGWTSDQLEELSEEIRRRLGAVVSKPIERACVRAVNAGENRGAGARTRILETFEVAGKQAIDQAQEKANELLQDRFRVLHGSLGRLLRENEDPISQCHEAIVKHGASLAEQAGREERERVAAAITRIRAVLESSPTPSRASAPPPRLPSTPPAVAGEPVVPEIRGLHRGAGGVFDDFRGDA